jgi:adenylate kinase
MREARRGQLIYATAIAGCGEKQYLEEFKRYCEERGKIAKIHNVGEMLFKYAAERVGIVLDKDNVLNQNNQVLDAARGMVLTGLIANIERDLAENDVVVINHHESFYWREAYIPVFNDYFLAGLRPDMFVSFIDNGAEILKRLSKKSQWQNQVLDEKDVYLWQNTEVNSAMRSQRLWAPDKKFFVMPVRQPVQTLYSLVFEPWKPIVYAQMPISHVTEEELKEVRRFIRKTYD